MAPLLAFILTATSWLLPFLVLLTAGAGIWTIILQRRNRLLQRDCLELKAKAETLEKRAAEAAEALDQTREKLGREHGRLQFIFDSIPTGVALSLVGPDGQMERWVNQAQWKICGMDPVVGEIFDFSKMTHPEDQRAQQELQARLDQGELDHYSLEKRYIRADGMTVWVTFTVQRRRFEDGGFEDLSTVVDITALKHSQQEAAHERELLRTLLDHCPDYIYFKDLESRFIMTSKSHAECVGVDSPEEMIGKTDFDYFPESHAQQALADEQEIIRTGKPLIGRVEKEIHSNLAGGCWIIATKMAFRNREGRIIGTFGISRDITSIKKAEAELEQTHRRLLEASRQAGMAEVATSVLHNVGNVLNSVNVSASVIDEKVRRSKSSSIEKLSLLIKRHADNLGTFLTEDAQGQQIPGFLESLAGRIGSEREEILAELKSLRTRIEHIKEIVAMQQNYAKVSGMTEQLSVVDLVEDALSINAAAFVRHGVDVIREFEGNPTVTTDRHKLLQVLVNVLRNAKQACFESGLVNKNVTIRISASDERVEIAIQDNGVGISADDLPKIFSHGFTTKKDGHGFGLHSGALAIKELGGTFNVHSDGLGEGARFVITLPLDSSRET